MQFLGTKKLLEKATAHLATAVYQNNEHLKHQMYQIRLRQIRKASLHDFVSFRLAVLMIDILKN